MKTCRIAQFHIKHIVLFIFKRGYSIYRLCICENVVAFFSNPTCFTQNAFFLQYFIWFLLALRLFISSDITFFNVTCTCTLTIPSQQIQVVPWLFACMYVCTANKIVYEWASICTHTHDRSLMLHSLQIKKIHFNYIRCCDNIKTINKCGQNASQKLPTKLEFVMLTNK